MNYSPSKRKLIIAIALDVCMALLFIGVISFLFSKINAFEEATYNSYKYTTNSDKVFKLKKEIGDLESEIVSLNNFFIQPGEEAYLLEKIESLAEARDVKLETESVFDGKTPKDGFLPLQVGIRFSGEWSKVSSFVRDLENMPLALEISNINLNTNSEGLWSGTASLNIYKWPQ